MINIRPCLNNTSVLIGWGLKPAGLGVLRAARKTAQGFDFEPFGVPEWAVFMAFVGTLQGSRQASCGAVMAPKRHLCCGTQSTYSALQTPIPGQQHGGVPRFVLSAILTFDMWEKFVRTASLDGSWGALCGALCTRSVRRSAIGPSLLLEFKIARRCLAKWKQQVAGGDNTRVCSVTTRAARASRSRSIALVAMYADSLRLRLLPEVNILHLRTGAASSLSPAQSHARRASTTTLLS